MTRDEVLNEIEILIDLLKGPLPQQEIANGWDADHQSKGLAMMRDIRDLVRHGGRQPNFSIVRTMDSWGVSGELFLQACDISNHLDDFKD